MIFEKSTKRRDICTMTKEVLIFKKITLKKISLFGFMIFQIYKIPNRSKVMGLWRFWLAHMYRKKKLFVCVRCVKLNIWVPVRVCQCMCGFFWIWSYWVFLFRDNQFVLVFIKMSLIQIQTIRMYRNQNLQSPITFERLEIL